MHEDNGAFEGFPNCIGRFDVSGHVCVVGFRALHGPIDGIEDYSHGLALGHLLNDLDEFRLLFDEVERDWLKIEWRCIGTLGHELLAKGLNAGLNPRLPLEST